MQAPLNPTYYKPSRAIEKTVLHIRQKSQTDSSHDWPHIERVWKLARHIGEKEGADPLIVQLGALLHDIADWKFHDGDENAGPEKGKKWLASLEVPEETAERVIAIIREVTYKGAGVDTKVSSRESAVVQDADRLDAIGAIGIGRAFAYGGHKNRPMHDPSSPPEMHATFEDYKKKQSTTVNHFYEKLFRLKDRMNTETGRRLAVERHAFMEDFLRRFLEEWAIQVS